MAANYVTTDTVDAIMSAVESADRGIAFLVENDFCVVFDSAIVNTGEEAFEDWFFHNPTGDPTMDNLPEDYEGGVLALIPYNETAVEAVVALEGGLVQDVYTNMSGHYRVVDRDIEGADPGSEIIATVDGAESIVGHRFATIHDVALVQAVTEIWEQGE